MSGPSKLQVFFADMESYYGKYKSADHKDLTEQYIRKRFREEDLPMLRKYVLENQHPNYGPPIVSAIKRATTVAYKEDMYSFARPKRSHDVSPMCKCEKCGKLFPMDMTSCAYCGAAVGCGIVSVPHDYFK